MPKKKKSEEVELAETTTSDSNSRKARVVALANQKGGVGKTTTAVNLGACLGDLGQKVLVLDLDPQGNATTGLGLMEEKIEASTYDVLLHGTPLAEAIYETAFPNLSVAAATSDLAGAEVELVSLPEREYKLRQAIESVLTEFDFVFIDCPPSLGLLTINGLVAAKEILLPIQCEYYALEGVGQLVQNTELIRSSLNQDLKISTVVMTMYDARTKLSSQVAKDVQGHFGNKVCKTVIPRSVRLSEAPSFGQPISVFDPLSRGAIAYKDLAQEVMERG